MSSNIVACVICFFICFSVSAAQYGGPVPSGPQPGYGGPATAGPGSYPSPGGSSYGGQVLPPPGTYGGTSPGGGAYPGPGPAGPGRCNYDQNCYDYQSGSALSTALPFERRAPSMCDECVTLCTQRRQNLTDKYQCSTAVYDYTYMTCDLFAVTGNTGYFSVVPYNNRDVFVARPSCVPGPGPSSTPSTPTARPPSSSTCQANEVVRYLGVMGFVQSGNDDYAPTTITDLPTCAQACSDNRLPDGTQINCASFDFGPGTTCHLSRSAVAPTGTGRLESAANAGYFEKICVLAAAVANCNNPIFDRYPNKILVGFAQTAINAASFDECLNACLQSQERFGFACQSGQFFAPAGGATDMNCIINTETKDSNADLFSDTDESTDYFQIDCNQAGGRNALAIRRLDGSSRGPAAPVSKSIMKDRVDKNERAATLLDKWTMWSLCGATDNRRTRYRRCEFLDIRECPKETEPCIQRDVPSAPDDVGKAITETSTGTLPVQTVPNDEAVIDDRDAVIVDGQEVQLNKCLCMTDSRGRRRCDVGIKYTRNGAHVQKQYCNDPS